MYKRNGTIDFMRFWFCIAVFLHHSSFFGHPVFIAGGVEFFFIISGILFVHSVDRYAFSIRGGYSLIKHKLAGFYPEFLASTIVGMLVVWGTVRAESSASEKIIHFLSDCLLLQIWGFPVGSYTGVMWYLSTIIPVNIIIFYFLKQHRTEYIFVIAPISVLMIYSGMFLNYHTIGAILEPLAGNFLQVGLLRAFAGMTLGVLGWYVSNVMKNTTFTRFGRQLLTLLEIGCYFATFVLMLYMKYNSEIYFVFVPLMVIAVTISFSEQSYLYPVLLRPFTKKLATFTLVFFMNHVPAAWLVGYMKFSFSNDKKLFVYLGISLLLTAISYILSQWIRAMWPKLTKALVISSQEK